MRGCNDVKFFNQYLCTLPFPGAFQLDIFLHCIFTISWLISNFAILNILKLFSTAFEPLNVLVKFFSWAPDITPKFNTIFRIWDNSVTLFFSVQIFVHLILVHLKWLVLPELLISLFWIVHNFILLCNQTLLQFFNNQIYSITRFMQPPPSQIWPTNLPWFKQISKWWFYQFNCCFLSKISF